MRGKRVTRIVTGSEFPVFKHADFSAGCGEVMTLSIAGRKLKYPDSACITNTLKDLPTCCLSVNQKPEFGLANILNCNVHS